MKEAILIDMWYGDDHLTADKITVAFYDLDNEYRGNIYRRGEIIGDFSARSWEPLEKAFPQLTFKRDLWQKRNF